MKSFLVAILLFLCLCGQAQMYFPPVSGSTWDTLPLASMNYCPEKLDSLYQFLEKSNSKAFILLKDGKIVLEKYFNGHSASSPWYWASAGKSLTAFLVGLAQEKNFLAISDTTSQYLGQGWTSCTPVQENKVTIRHQLTMTTGLDDYTGNPDCSLDSCLIYKADPGSRWAYHNGPYTLLDSVLESASNMSANSFVTAYIKPIIGMGGSYIKSGFNNVYWSDARSMARYGLLILNKGKWNTTTIMQDTSYFYDMTHSSQLLNPAYGYLWWLNGTNKYMLPGIQLVFNTNLFINAPNDVFCAMGKNGQLLNISPSQNMVWIRMGNTPDSSGTLVPNEYNNEIWKRLNQLTCPPQSIETEAMNDYSIIPNPTMNHFKIHNGPITHVNVLDILGHKLISYPVGEDYDISSLAPGIYIVEIENGNKSIVRKRLLKK